MTRRRFLLTSLAGTRVIPRSVEAQAQVRGGVYRIGYVGVTPSPQGRRGPGEQLFIATLRDLGYVEGNNLTIEWRYGGDRPERYAEIATELVGLRVDVFVTIGMVAVRAVKQATNTIPIVMAVSEDPVGAGLAASLARPGGNVTGFTRDVGRDVMTKTLQLLREAVPVSRVGLVFHPEANAGLNQLMGDASGLGIVLRQFPVRTPDDISRVYAVLSRKSVDALYILGNNTTLTHRRMIIDLSAAHRIPTIYWFRQPVTEGGLLGYGPDFNDSLRGTAHYVALILSGTHPGTLPIQQPTKFELVINLKTAKALGVTIPPSLLLRADQVIE